MQKGQSPQDQQAAAGKANVRPTRAGNPVSEAAFLAAIESVLVSGPIYYEFPGAIERDVAASIWSWIERDVAEEASQRLREAIASGSEPVAAFDLVITEILDNLKAILDAEQDDIELERRNTIQMGGDEHRAKLALVIMAMRRRPLLQQAAAFGTSIGKLQDEAIVATALQNITITNPITRALWMQAMVGHISNPSRVMAAAVKLVGGNSDSLVSSSEYAPLVQAMLSHAQSQISLLAAQPGAFNDLDLACRAVDRYHRLMRAINNIVEIERKSEWGMTIAGLIGRVSERLERPIREVSPSVTQSLRRPRDGADRVDPDEVLAALNGLYLLTVVRRCRDSLAVNALLDQAWTETGQALEVLVTRALDTFRANPVDSVLRERLEAGIKMAEIRFNPEYADILRKARDGAEKRIAQG